MKQRLWKIIAALILSVLSISLQAEEKQWPVIAIIIDDLGDRLDYGERTVALPGPVACAILPHTPHARRLAKKAHASYKEVMLHLPMQPMGAQFRPGPGVLTLDMTHEQFLRTLEEDLASVPHVQGINNHMGSLITRHPGHMAWLMSAIQEKGDLFFVDSRTHKESVAMMFAQEHGVPSMQRDVFLDRNPDIKMVDLQFQRLIKVARKQGYAVGIGHPYASTLEVLERELKQLDQYEVQLVPVSMLLEQMQQRSPTWQASLSPSPKAAKN